MKKIKSRIEQAKTIFFGMRKMFIRVELSMLLRIRLLRYYVFSVFLYGCKTWTFDTAKEKQIDAFELYLYNRILKIPQIEVLCRMSKES